ncbi:MAG: hypothetical protein NVSMB30_23350 [Hymenobacter sp.]
MKKTLLLVLAWLIVAPAMAQTQVTGKVQDAAGGELPGVTVLVKGTGQGTATDEKGLFSLNCTPDSRLVISFLGYVAQEVAVGGRSTINVTLAADSKQLDLTYYRNNVDGLILNVPMSPSKGIPNNTILQNVGAMYNRGFEAGITAGLVNQGKFTWTANVNYTMNKNLVTELYGAGTEIVGTTSTSSETTNITRVGFPVGSLFGARTDGANPANGRRVFINRNGERVQYNHAVPSGQSRWTYLDGTTAPAISVADYQLLGNALPTWYGGFNNTLKYGNFDLTVNFTYSGGNYVMNGTKATWRDQRFWNNSTEVLERWTTPGQVTDIPRVVYGDLLSNGSSFPISANVEKADYLRLQSAGLGYRLPLSWLGTSGISSVRLYAQVFNAFILTRYTGTDPDISSNGNTNTTPGVDKNSVPQGRTFTLGVNVGF